MRLVVRKIALKVLVLVFTTKQEWTYPNSIKLHTKYLNAILAFLKYGSTAPGSTLSLIHFWKFIRESSELPGATISSPT